MQYRPLGKTEISISALSFGAGPVSTLMVGDADEQRQTAVVSRALDAGINWFDTAATYGSGRSEQNLGRVLRQLGAVGRVHVATKVRLIGDDLNDIRGAVRRSVEGSLQRLGVPSLTLLQLHNSITAERDDEPTSLTPADVLRPHGILDAFQELQGEGLVHHFGLTGIGQPGALREVIRSREFETVQVPYHLLNPSAGRKLPSEFAETNYDNIIKDCLGMDMGVLAIRVLAGGALAGNSPSPHTLKTPFFPLELYERDRDRAARLQNFLGPERRLSCEAVRFVLSHPQIHSALIGFAEIWQIDEALKSLAAEVAPVDWNEVLAAGSSV